MSDKQKGLGIAIDELLPGCEHRFYVMHLYQNFKANHKGLALKNILWSTTRATRVVDFERALTEMKEKDSVAYDWRDERKKYKGELCPIIAKFLEDTKLKAMEYIAHWNGRDQFEIETSYGNRYKLHLGDMTCSCRRWDLTGIPCAHAVCGMFYCGYNPYEFVSPCYRKDTYFKSYTHLMGALDRTEMWSKSSVEPLLPPINETLPSRPKLHNRKKS
ncbi:hypothetical protein BUALT_Bualt09G0030500 [Buddleja alternifolia]|uniref:SWIM-type domain-containing protein n=1 Tax=Buddleja alternifolia TaxID=168488 RepID=A0AAV6X662_9LAMI|nr:hypothetical protein BUALT_Bualt09G0030500 [Buddleja alternifolia]